MKRLLFHTFLICAVLALASFTGDSWQAFVAADKSYSVEFPLTPNTSKETVDSPMGKLQIEMTVADLEANPIPNDKNMVYVVASTIYPDAIITVIGEKNYSLLYEGAINSALSNMDSEAISRKEIIKQGIKGVEVKADYAEGAAIITMQIFLKGNTMYMLQTICEPAHDGNETAARFYESFKWL